MKIRSINELQDFLDEEMSWRRKELTTLFFLVADARRHQESVFIRSAITLLYAHWEGYIKNACLAYLTYICFIGESYNRLKINFIALGVEKSANFSGSYTNFNSCESVTNFFSNQLSDKFSISPEKVINTHSNLSTDVLKDIFNKTGLNYTHDFELNEKRIDEKLLGYRNKIAHGERSYEIDDLRDSYVELKTLVVNLLDNVRDQIINSVENKLYLNP
jgi:hypothetical protein